MDHKMYANMITAQKRLCQQDFFILQVTGEYGIFFNKNVVYTMAKQSQYSFKNQ
jgi:hypothetical protein